MANKKEKTIGFIHHHFYKTKSGEGFTILELIVVIGIIGLITQVAFVALQSARDEARLKGGLQFADQVRTYFGASEKLSWTFEDGGATVDDESGNDNLGQWKIASTDNPATDLNGTGNYGAGIRGQAADIQGDGSEYIYYDLDDWATPEFTISIWAKANTPVLPADLSNASSLFSTVETPTNPGANTWQIDTHNNTCDPGSGNIWYRFRYGYDAATPGGATLCIGKILFDKWHHIAVSYDSPNIKVYMDGHLTNEQDVSPNIFIPLFHEYKVGINRATDDVAMFNGLIDEVSLYKESLSSAQIQKLYAEGAKRHKIATH